MQIAIVTLQEHDSVFQTRRVIHARLDKGLPDCKIQTTPQGAPGIVVCVRSELGKHVRSDKYTAGKDFSFPLAQGMSSST